MPALVTGGGGFLGLYIVEQLIARGETVRVLCRGSYPRLKELGVEALSGDIRDPGHVATACAGIDTVYHTAAVSGIWGAWDYYHEINPLGTRNVVAACRQAEVRRLVYTSSPSVVYDGRNHCGANESLPYPARYLCPYPETKALAEQAVLSVNGIDGLVTCALRPHLIWGPRDNHLIPRLITRAKAGQLRRVGDGQNLISMSYVENAAAAHVQAADRLNPDAPEAAPAGRAYFINEPEPVNLWGWINELLTLAGMPAVRRGVPENLAYAAGGALEFVYSSLGWQTEPRMTRFLAQQLGGSHYYDISNAKRDFGYQPVVSVEEGLKRLRPELQRLAWGDVVTGG